MIFNSTMSGKIKHKILSYLITSIWLANGLFCKVLNLVPRHEKIVSSIVGHSYSSSFTLVIGVLETMMAVWIVSGIKARLNAVSQIIIVAMMNTLEFILVPDLLLWGRFNAFFALLFIIVVYYNEFHLNKNSLNQCSMFSILKNHPFAVEAFFESSLVLTFAVPKEQLQALIPECLQLDTFKMIGLLLQLQWFKQLTLDPKVFLSLWVTIFF